MILVIFDFDGVIVDSEKEKFTALQKILAGKGIGLHEDQYNNFLGKKREHFLQEAFPEVPEHTRKIIMSAVHASDETLQFTLMPDVKELLDRLRSAGCAIALASGTQREVIMKVLQQHGITHYFSSIVTGTEVAESKPDPAAFNKTISLAGVHEKMYIIEDSPAGLAAAAQTGATVIGFGEHANTTIQVKNHAELLRWFKDQLR